MKVPFVCPVCKGHLEEKDRTLRCPSGHCYDMARQGYVNLLRSQQSSSKRHGDDKMMVESRRAFLDKGRYSPLLDALLEELASHGTAEMHVLDAGCGECYYTAAIYDRLTGAGLAPTVCGVDISRDALIAGKRRSRELHLAVASVFDMPLPDGWADAVVNVFAPLSEGEICRILKPGGVLVRALPLPGHLWSLKEAIYDRPYPNKPERLELDGMRLLTRRSVSYELLLDNSEDIQALFRMTPYYYKTSAADQAKAAALPRLTTQAQFDVVTYTKA